MIRILLVLLCLSPLLSATSYAQIQPFEARYQAKFKGVPIGSGERRLSLLPGGEYQLENRASALGGSMTYDVTARFEYQQQTIVSLGYHHTQTAPFKKLSARGFPDRKGGLIVVFDNKERMHFPPEEDQTSQLLDAASFSVQLQHDIKRGLTDITYYYNTLDEMDKHRFEVLGNEQVTTQLGNFDTVKVEQRKNDSRVTYLWLAPALDYQVVKAEIVRKGKSWATLETTYLKIADDILLTSKSSDDRS